MNSVILFLVCVGLYGLDLTQTQSSAQVYKFENVSDCASCNFVEQELLFNCEIDQTTKETSCYCEFKSNVERPLNWKVYIDYDNDQCAVGRFGPCGEKNGIKVGCYGGLTCKNWTCINETQPRLQHGEHCDKVEQCEDGSKCYQKPQEQVTECFKLHSIEHNRRCFVDEDCQKPFRCVIITRAGPNSESLLKFCCTNAKDQPLHEARGPSAPCEGGKPKSTTTTASNLATGFKLDPPILINYCITVLLIIIRF